MSGRLKLPCCCAGGADQMDRHILNSISEELDSSDVAGLCFLCSDVIKRKRLEGIEDAKKLFLRLEEKALLENRSFLSQLLKTIHRADLLNLLQTDNRQMEETDANPILSDYRVMLYNIYEDMTKENLENMKYLLSSDLGRRQLEMSKTALDVFLEMEKMGLISKSNVQKLHELLQQFDQKLASNVHNYMEGLRQQRGNIVEPPHVSMDQQYYPLVHSPRGLCVVFNNEDFLGPDLSKRNGTHEDATNKVSSQSDSRLSLKTHISDGDASSVALKVMTEKPGTDLLALTPALR
ncbi:caspase-8-like [Xenentodon cancila]